MTITITEVENMKLGELRGRKDELVHAMEDSAADDLGINRTFIVDLAKRYIQASIDAKARDEKLGEQAETLYALKVGLSAADEKAAAAEMVVKDLEGQIEKLCTDQTELNAVLQKNRDAEVNDLSAKYEAAVEAFAKQAADTLAAREETDSLHSSQMAAMNGELGKAQRRSARLKIQAEKFTAAVSGIHKTAMDAIQSQAIADADNEGE